jgi:hypothetical protein
VSHLSLYCTTALARYGERTQSECPKLAKLHSNYSWLKEGTKGASVSKYTDPNYV